MGLTRIAAGLVLFLAAPLVAQDSRPGPAPVVETPMVAGARAAVEAADRDFGSDTIAAASARRRLALQLEAAGRLADAVAADREVLAILEKNPAAKPGQVAMARGEIAVFLYHLNRMDEALPVAREAVKNAEIAFGKTNKTTAKFLYVLAGIERDTGRIEDAEATLRRALAIHRDPAARDPRNLVDILQGLGEVLVDAGRYAEARAALSEAARIAREETTVPAGTAALAECVLGILEDALGRFGEARLHFEKQLELLEAGSSRPDAIPLTIANIAHVLRQAGDDDGARRAFERSLAAFGPTPQAKNLSYVLQELAHFELVHGNAEKAHALASRAVLAERGSPEINPARLGRAVKLQALVLHAKGQLADALALLEEALALERRALGDRSRVVAGILDAKARVFAALGKKDEARALFHQAVVNAREWFALATEALSESERLASIWPIRSMMDAWLSIAPLDAANGPEIADEVLAWQGQVLRALGAERTWLRSHADPEIVALRSRLVRIADDLAPERLLVRGGHSPSPSAPLAHELMTERERIERELAARAPPGSGLPAGSATLSAALAPDEALVDYFVFNKVDPAAAIIGTGREGRVMAIVLHRGRPAVAVDLGPMEGARNAVSAHLRFVSRFFQPDPAAEPVVATAAAGARHALWDPVAPLLSGASRVFVIPDSFIAALPFETLPGRDPGRYLIEDVEFVYLPVAQERLRPDRGAHGRGALLVGGVDFGTSHEPETEDARALRGALGLPLEPLPKSAAEVSAVAATLSRAGFDDASIVRLGGAAATEAAVKASVAGKRFVHLATHGIFAAEPVATPGAAGSRVGFKTPTALEGFLPFTRAAVALAGVNERGGSGADDGLLTAAEAAWLDLADCELVALSGCESGLGSARSGEELLGLRRALHLAGARATVTALWRVRDEDAETIMTAFYEGLLTRNLGKSQALRAARLAMLARNRAGSGGAGLPGTWGAFVLDGDWK